MKYKRVVILFFANLKDHAGTKNTIIELPENGKVSDIKEKLKILFPNLIPYMDSIVVSVNREFAFDDQVVPDEAEVAFFPPVSGGGDQIDHDIFKIIDGEINLNDIITQLSSGEVGAVCIFSGMVRGVTDRGGHRETQYLYYEAYQSMAEEKMEQVAKEIRTRWPEVVGIAILQRVGKLAPGTPTVVIACSAAHRDTGIFEAARYGIDRLKQIVPVWKQEIGTLGEIWVDGDYLPSEIDKK